MNKAFGFLTFAIGATAGSVVTWRLLKTKYERIAQEEIDSVKSKFSYKIQKESEHEQESKHTIVDTEVTKDKPDIMAYTKKVGELGYTNYSNPDAHTEESEEDIPQPQKYFGDANSRPYVISPDAFGEFDDYDKISLTYYADGILADDNDEILEDVEGTVGYESLGHFGEYENDSVHVRNDRLKADFEILKSLRDYSEVVSKKPYLNN